jgi:hypothetical protein
MATPIDFMDTKDAVVAVGFEGEVDNSEDTENAGQEEAVDSPQTDARLDLNDIPPTIPSPNVVKLDRSRPTSAISRFP